MLTPEGVAFVRRPSDRALCWGRAATRALPRTLPFCEILGARVAPDRACCVATGYRVLIHTFRRPASRPCGWTPRVVSLSTRSADVASSFAARVTSAAHAATPRRPASLLVFVNPYGGARAARRVWQDVAGPLLSVAGVETRVVETDAPGAARAAVETLTPATLATIDGIVAVGGDGLFHEVLNGVLALRSRVEREAGASAAPAAAATATAAARLRLGHIPAGSTDALAYSIHGTRSPAAAALHVALGDAAPLDVLALKTASGGGSIPSSPPTITHAACVASYGYMGTMLALSERLRWLGPARYNVAGALALVAGGSVGARVAWKPAPPGVLPPGACGPECGTCARAGWPWVRRKGEHTPAGTPRRPRGGGSGAFLLSEGQGDADDSAPTPSSSSPLPLPPAGWRHRDGRYAAVMLAALPCRSDRSVHGLAPDRHLADGLATLIAVDACSRTSFLAFLLAVARGRPLGEVPGVTLATVTAASLSPLPGAPPGAWNVDGESLPDAAVEAAVLRGAVAVFARGVET